ncbi:MAG TPA: hypothetical protein GXZ64_09930 [Clostridiaceae bacterium]|jgi:hypothetical protein|nr:hypothetical protein [Clostridiaceae bacterium]
MDNEKKAVLFYVMQGEMMCVQHVFLNALDLFAKGHAVSIIFEGQSVKLPPQIDGKNALYDRCKREGLIAGVCKACSAQLGSLEANEQLGLTILDDMNGHAGMRRYLEDGYEVVLF